MPILNLPPDNWGKYYFPATSDKHRQSSQLNIVIFCSYGYGYAALRTLINLSKIGFNIDCVVTDDIKDHRARINKKNRFWKNYSIDQQQALLADIVKLSLRNHIPVYTGSIKHEIFYNIIEKTNPNLFILAGFGQILNSKLFTFPSLGGFNIHPGTNLSKREYRGVDPISEIIKNNEQYSYMNIHAVNDVIDGGQIIGKSPPINLRFQHRIENTLSKKMMVFHKVSLAAPYLVENLVYTAISSLKNKESKITQLFERTNACTKKILELPIQDMEYTFIRPSEDKVISKLTRIHA